MAPNPCSFLTLVTHQRDTRWQQLITTDWKKLSNLRTHSVSLSTSEDYLKSNRAKHNFPSEQRHYVEHCNESLNPPIRSLRIWVCVHVWICMFQLNYFKRNSKLIHKTCKMRWSLPKKPFKIFVKSNLWNYNSVLENNKINTYLKR